MVKRFLTPRWTITTALVILAVMVMVWLGFWQLDRLEQRREFNERVEEQINAAPLNLNQELQNGSFPLEYLNGMEYRKVEVRGQYRPQEEMSLRNQVWENQPGYHLLTPLEIEGTDYVVIVDRGWIPLDQNTPPEWMQYTESGTIELSGQIQLAQNNRRFGAPDPTLAPEQTRLEAWNAVNLNRISSQVQGELLPVYIMAAPTGDNTSMPYRALEQPDLSEGSHFGYALQWFSFAGVLALGYPFFVRKQLHDEAREPVRKNA